MNDIVPSLKVVADPTRWKILHFLLEPTQSDCARAEGVCACDLETFLDLRQPTISHHMKLLEQAGFITAVRQGRWVFYEIRSEKFADIQAWLEPFSHYQAKPTFKESSSCVS